MITVLVGQNDSGKTFVLEGIDAALRDDVKWHYSASLEAFVRAPLHKFLDREMEHVTPDGDVNEAWLHEAHAEPPPDMSAELVERLLSTGVDGDGELAVVTAPVGGLPLAVWRCTAPWEDLDSDLRDELTRAWPAGAEGSIERPWRPIPLRPMATLHSSALLQPIRVPTDEAGVERQLADTVVALCRALRLLPFRTRSREGMEPLGLDFDDAALPTWAEEDDPEYATSARWLIDESGDTATVHRYARWASRVIETTAQDMLPSFVTERYRVCVSPRSVTHIAREQPVEVLLEDLSTERRFPLRRAAAGYQVWLQLGLQEAAARIGWYGNVLDQAAERLERFPSDLFLLDEVEAEQAEQLHHSLKGVLFSLRNPEFLDKRFAEELFDGRFLGFALDDSPVSRSLFEPAKQRLYLIDEPEQRLHPALQRSAAAWLAELMEEWGAQCILATHSFAFIDMPGDPAVYEAVRRPAGAALVPVDLEQFTPHAQLAREMGFDRGEMLAQWNAFLFVEGAGDVAVFENLFAERLTSARILISAVHGHRHHAGLLEMQLLLRGTATPIAALLDGVSEADIQRIRSDGAFREEMLGARDERGTVASIVKAEIETGRQVEIVTVGKSDIFDLLDEDAIRQVCSDKFPGHDAALRDFRRAGGGNASVRKDFYWKQYGVAVRPRSLARIASTMRESGRIPEILEDALDRVERLSLRRV